MLIYKESSPKRTEEEIQQNRYYMFDDQSNEWVLVQGASPEDDLEAGLI